MLASSLRGHPVSVYNRYKLFCSSNQVKSLLVLSKNGVNLLKISYFNRKNNKIEREIVYGDSAIRWMYEGRIGKALSGILTSRMVSNLYGKFQDTSLSSRKVAKFVKNFSIPLNDYLPEEGKDENSPYSSFNQFFIRRFKAGKRNFVSSKKQMAAFSEARYFGHQNHQLEMKIPVKGKYFTPLDLLGSEKWAKTFGGGPLLIARLCPVDYHRFHFPDSGEIIEEYSIPGLFHSVNPLALKKKADIFITNERHVSILETANFGKIAYIEVGAMCVGKIVMSHLEKTFKRGDEKGYFLFGGSTVIVLGEKGRWSPSADIILNTNKSMETYVELGDEIATVIESKLESL